jgi:hypothetical protein
MLIFINGVKIKIFRRFHEQQNEESLKSKEGPYPVPTL